MIPLNQIDIGTDICDRIRMCPACRRARSLHAVPAFFQNMLSYIFHLQMKSSLAYLP